MRKIKMFSLNGTHQRPDGQAPLYFCHYLVLY